MAINMDGTPQAPMQAPQPRGLLGGFFGPEGRDARSRLAIGLEGLAMNPNQALIGQLQQGIETRATASQKNATIEWLRSRGHDDLAAALEAGAPPQEVLAESMRRMQPKDPMEALNLRLAQLKVQEMENPQPGFRRATPEESAAYGAQAGQFGPDGRFYAEEVPQPTDPMDALNLQMKQLELEQMQNPQPEFRRATAEEAAAYGAQGGQFGPDGRFYAVDVPQGMTIESDGAGGFRMVQGPVGAGAAKPFTEGQSKDVVYATRAQGALEVLDPIAGELTNLGSQMAGSDPTGIIRGRVQSPEYQIARNAGDEFLQAILRKDTGAAITASEQALYGQTYLPQPGDGPQVLEAKRVARQRAVAAINAGMSPSQIIATERALGGAPAGDMPSDDALLKMYGG